MIDLDVLVCCSECIRPATTGETNRRIALGHFGQTTVCLGNTRDTADLFDQEGTNRSSTTRDDEQPTLVVRRLPKSYIPSAISL